MGLEGLTAEQRHVDVVGALLGPKAAQGGRRTRASRGMHAVRNANRLMLLAGLAGTAVVGWLTGSINSAVHFGALALAVLALVSGLARLIAWIKSLSAKQITTFVATLTALTVGALGIGLGDAKGAPWRMGGILLGALLVSRLKLADIPDSIRNPFRRAGYLLCSPKLTAFALIPITWFVTANAKGSETLHHGATASMASFGWRSLHGWQDVAMWLLEPLKGLGS